MLFMATSDREGRTTVSPRGGVPGFVAVLDERRMAFADVIGNNLIDSLTHIVDNPHVGLLFVIPGRHETLRVEGNAWVTTDPDVLAVVGEPEGKPPKVAIGVEVTSTFIHCSRSFERGHVWDPETWDGLVGPSAMELFRCHLADNLPPDEMPARRPEPRAEGPLDRSAGEGRQPVGARRRVVEQVAALVGAAVDGQHA